MPSSEVITANYHGVLTAAIKGALGDEVGDQLVGEIELAFLADQADAYDDIEPHFFPDAVALARYAGHMGVAQMVVTSRKHEGHGTASPRSIMQRSRFGRYIWLQSSVVMITLSLNPTRKSLAATEKY